MKKSWDDLQIFLALERAGTARGAAERLNMSHSTVSRRLDAMEHRFKAKLFDRTPEGFVVNAAGARILGRAQQIEAEMMELERSVIGSDVRLQGDIRLTGPPPVTEYVLLPILADFRADYPLITIEVISTFGESDLSRRDADVAIRFSPKPHDYLIGRRLPDFNEAVYVSPSYAEAHWDGDKAVDPEWIGWNEEGRLSMLARRVNFPNAPVNWKMPTLQMHAQAAVEGFGMTSLPCVMGDAHPGLIRAPGARITEGYPGWLLTHPDLRRMERVRVLARYIGERLNAQADRVNGKLDPKA